MFQKMLILFQDPNTARWAEVAKGFEKRWNLPHCLGPSIGNIWIKALPKSGSLYFHYKQLNSIELLTIMDHNYEFMYVDVGEEG